tara:strand:- start:277 stop:735 length:459 start_codon:yes stop_codon:yes gene_type:complete
MANKKQPYNWNKVKPGDIISFRYKTESTGKSLVNSVLVLNPKISFTRKDGSSTFHLNGIKLEESNKISLRLDKSQIKNLENIGKFIKIDNKNNLYKLQIDRNLILNEEDGAKQRAYKLISKNIKTIGQYRTYNWKKATKVAVFLEPIRVYDD